MKDVSWPEPGSSGPVLARPFLGVMLISLALGFAVTGAVWVDPLHRVIDSPFTDGHLLGAHLGAEALRTGGLLELHTALAGWPEGVMFRPFLWPVILLSLLVGPVLALNLAWALTPALGALGGWALARQLGASSSGAALSGLLLAWPMWSRVTLGNGQVEQAILGAVALVWAAALAAESASGWRVLVAPALLLGLGLAAPNAGLAALLGLAALGLGRLIFRGPGPLQSNPPPLRAPSAPRLRWVLLWALSLGAALLIDGYHAANYEGVPNLYRPRSEATARSRTPVPPPETLISGWSATQTNRLSKTSLRALTQPAGPTAFINSPSHVPYLGWTLLLAGLIGLFRGGRRAAPLGLVIGSALLLSLGARIQLFGQAWWMPWALVERLSASAAANGTPYRLVIGAVVGLCGVAGAGLLPARTRGSHLAARPRTNTLLVALVGGAAWAETSALPGPGLPLPTRPLSVHPALVLLAGSDKPAIDIPFPFHRECETVPPHYMTGTLLHGRPLLHNLDPRGSYFSQTAAVQRLDRLLGDPSCATELREALNRMGVGALIAHKEEPCAIEPRVAACLDAALGPPVVDDAETRAWRVQ